MTEDSVTAINKKLLSRNEAIELGLKRYFTGKPCRRGHISERLVSDHHCVQCAYYKNNQCKEYHQAYQRQWKEKNPGYLTEWLSKRPGYQYKYYAKFVAENPGALRIYWQRSRKKRSSAGKLSVGLADRLMSLQRGKCACCRRGIRKSFHLDHIEPLSKGGANEDLNIQLLCPSCNKSKHAKHPIDFMQERGFLI